MKPKPRSHKPSKPAKNDFKAARPVREMPPEWYDAEERLVEAADKYENLIARGMAKVETYLDLAVLYLDCTDADRIAFLSLPDTFVARAWTRAGAVLREAQEKFGPNTELEFWQRYLGFVMHGKEFSTQECENIARKGGTLVPFFYLFDPAGKRHREEAVRLLDQVRDGSTSRKRYIRGLLEAQIQRSRRIKKDF